MHLALLLGEGMLQSKTRVCALLLASRLQRPSSVNASIAGNAQVSVDGNQRVADKAVAWFNSCRRLCLPLAAVPLSTAGHPQVMLKIAFITTSVPEGAWLTTTGSTRLWILSISPFTALPCAGSFLPSKSCPGFMGRLF